MSRSSKPPIINMSTFNYHTANLSPDKQIRLVVMHCLVQWLAHKDLLFAWMDEVLNEDMGRNWTIEVRSERIFCMNNQSNAVRNAFSLSDCYAGGEFWMSVNDEWAGVCDKLMNKLQGGRHRPAPPGLFDDVTSLTNLNTDGWNDNVVTDFSQLFNDAT